jgi:signal peptidase I
VRRPGKSLAGNVVELAVVILTAIAVAFALESFVVKPYRIPSASMEPTLQINQRILVNRLGLDFGAPHVGDVVVFHPPSDYTACADPNQGETAGGTYEPQPCDVAQGRPSSTTFVKRVVGLPGDRLRILGGLVIRNGRPESHSSIVECGGAAACNFPDAIVVPRGDYYMMGDNRPDSEDSRFWGPVPASWLIGKAFLSYWPPDRIGLL